MSKTNRLPFAALILTFLNLAAGLFHYATQLLAAHRLSLAEFGNFGWMISAWSFASVLGLAIQMAVAMSGSPPSSRTRHRWKITGVGGAVLAAGVGFLIPQTGDWSWLFGALPALYAFHFFLGVLQRDLRFGALGVLVFSFALARFGFSFAQGQTLTGFAQAMAFTVGGVTILVLTFSHLVALKTGSRRTETLAAQGFSAWALLPASSQLLFPSNDVLVVRAFLGAEAAGVLGQSQLFSKILYFAPMSFLQLALPLMARQFRGELPVSDLRKFKHLRFALVTAVLAGALVFSLWQRLGLGALVAVPYPASHLVALGCLAIVPLYLVLEGVQRASVWRNQKGLLLFGMGLGGPWLIGAAVPAFGGQWSLETWLGVSLVWNLVLGAWACRL